MKVPCRITGSLHQDFDFQVSCKNSDPKGETSNWLIDSLQKLQHKANFLFLNFQLWKFYAVRQINKNILKRPKYAALLELCK